MATLVGHDGTITVGTAGATTLAQVTSWTSNLDVDDVDITSMDSGGHKEFAPGLDEFTIDFEARIASDQSLTALLPGATGTFTGTSSGDAPYITVSGGGYVKSLKVKTDMKGEVLLTGQWRGSGAASLVITPGT